jgi:hypothetical protein
MDILSRSLIEAHGCGELKGLILALEALTLTHNMYVDDLILFEHAKEGEL